MQALRAFLIASAALGVMAAGTAAQTGAPASGNDLPPGLVRQNGVIMMQPVSDSGEGGSGATSFGGERRQSLVHVLSAADHDLYSRAFDAAERGDWTAARAMAEQGQDPTARQLIEWRYLLDKNSGASFGQIAAFLKNNPDWPKRDTLFSRAEEAMDPAMDPHAVIAWFGDRTPVSGMGKIRLGEALISTGSAERGRDLVRQAWITCSFDPTQEFMVLQRHGDILTPEVDGARLEQLLARGDLAAARREMSRVTPEMQRLAAVRLALRTNPASGEREIDTLPDSQRNDPGLIFDQVHMLRQRDDVDAIPALLVRAPTREIAKINPTRWWTDLNLATRETLKNSDYRNAYAMAANTGLASDATEYSESEFLAGWVALRHLDEPRRALEHFRSLAETVSRPISRARAHYWEGRAYEAAGDVANARQQFRIASAFPETFYGQIALARLDRSPELEVPESAIDAETSRASYEGNDLTRAIRVLADLGYESLLREFSVHSADLYPNARHRALLAEDLTRMGFKEIALRVAKEASYDGVTMLEYSHPVISMPPYSGNAPAPEAAFVLGIIRQETEFDPDSVSSAGARGIMQIMPSTARRTAELAGLDYRPSALTGDVTYNMQLGMTELAGELADWGGSYVLAAAAYNAGPSNVRKWIATYGDPRDSRVDPVDWIEQIPFSETRNYVQRVIENMEVYRYRLAGRATPLRILTDLYRPNAPQIGPLPEASQSPS